MRVTFVFAILACVGVATPMYGQGVSPGGLRTMRVAPRVGEGTEKKPGTVGDQQKASPPEKPANEKSDSMDGEVTTPDECLPFFFADPRQVPPPRGSDVESLLKCIDRSREDIDRTLQAPIDVVRAHVNYKRLKQWAEAKTPKSGKEADPKMMEVQDRLAGLGRQVHRVLDDQGLSEPLSAMLFTGASFADSATDSSTGASSETKPDATPVGPSAMIVFESPHFGDDTSPNFHLAFGGKIGFQQIMSMVKPEKSAGSTASDLVAEYKDGLVWSAGVSAYTLARGQSEAYVRGSIGGTRVGDARSVVKNENDHFLAIPADSGSGASAARGEVGIGWNYYGRPMEVAHIQKSLLNPAFSAYTLYRWDGRFRKEGDLQDYRNPARRLVYGISVNLRPLIRGDGDSARSTKKETFDFGFSVEREFAATRTGQRIPDSTRYVVRGSINILNALTGAAKGDGAAADGSGTNSTPAAGK